MGEQGRVEEVMGKDSQCLGERCRVTGMGLGCQSERNEVMDRGLGQGLLWTSPSLSSCHLLYNLGHIH